MRTLVGLLIAFTPAVVHAGKVYNEGSGGTWDCKKDPTVIINPATARTRSRVHARRSS